MKEGKDTEGYEFPDDEGVMEFPIVFRDEAQLKITNVKHTRPTSPASAAACPFGGEPAGGFIGSTGWSALTQLLHQESSDPTGRALDREVRCARDFTPDYPMTPELFWEELKRDGFYFLPDPPGSDEHGRFFAHVVLDHAVALGRITGNTVRHHCWAFS